jgi:hypothetical protein
MAFVNKSERKFEYTQSNSTAIGPGAYLGQAEYKKSQSTAPFLTTTQRMNEDSLRGYSPGPGSYNPPEKHQRTLKDSTLRIPFTSRSERFSSKSSTLIPGPGSYNISTSYSKKRSRGAPRYSQPLVFYRTPSVPSIPTNQESSGYHPMKDGNLIRLFDNEMFMKSKESISNTNKKKEGNKSNPSKGTAWGKSKSKRVVDMKMATGNAIGPGSYNPTAGTLGATYKVKPSSMFASSSKRACQVPLSYRENISDSESGEEGSPGPGFYYDPDLQTGFRSKTVPKDNQCFSSKSMRFRQKETTKVGPGYYESGLQSQTSLKPGLSKAPFSSTNIRFKNNYEMNPGPGYYELDHSMLESERKALGRHGAFGITEKRFSSTKRSETPGPGFYPPDSYKKIGLVPTIENKPSSMFLSKSKRDLQAPQEKNASPAPGSYETAQTIGMKKSVSTGNLYASIMKLDRNKKKVGFNAQTDRFDEHDSRGNF